MIYHFVERNQFLHFPTGVQRIKITYNVIFLSCVFIKCKHHYFLKCLKNDISFISLTFIYLPLLIHEMIHTRH